MKKTEKSSPTYFIYEVPGVKIGCTTNPKGRVNGQGFNNYRILSKHKCIYIASFMERFLQAEHGYKIDQKPYYKTVNQLSSPESRAKISAKQTGRKLSDKTRAKMSESFKGKIFSDETRAKLRAAWKGRIVSEETCAKLTGQKRSEETRAKMRAAQKGKVTWNKGLTHSEESKAKISASIKENWKKRKAHEESL